MKFAELAGPREYLDVRLFVVVADEVVGGNTPSLSGLEHNGETAAAAR